MLEEWNKLKNQPHGLGIALEKRFGLYQRAKDASLRSGGVELLSIVQQVPPNQLTTADLQFAVTVLAQLDRSPIVREILMDAAISRTDFGDVFLAYIDSVCKTDAAGSERAHECLSLLAEGCVYLHVTPDSINLDVPVQRCLERLCIVFPSAAVGEALESLFAVNAVAASHICTLLIKVCVLAALRSNGAPQPDEELARTGFNDIPKLVWDLKSRLKLASSEDLSLVMTCLVYQRNPAEALRVYDAMPELHAPVNIRPLLLAAAAVSDYARLENAFNMIEREQSAGKGYSAVLGSQWYPIILKALGYLSRRDILHDVYSFVRREHPEVLGRGLYHALLTGYGARGELDKVLRYYREMLRAEVKPTTATFTIILQAYRDARDLKGALGFVNTEVLPAHQLTNALVSILLSLCGRRSDSFSAEQIWQWSRRFIKPDGSTQCQYIYALLSGNQFPKALRAFDELDPQLVTIHTLTVVLQAAPRYSEPLKLLDKVLALKDQLQLLGDDAYYVAYLSFLREQTHDLKLIESVFEEMRQVKVAPHASHYAIYTQALADHKQFRGDKRVARAMKEEHVPQRLSLISKQLRLLSAPGSSPRDREAARRAAVTLLKDGFFDPTSKSVPRDVLPAHVIKPVVKMLMKTKDFASAHDLLDLCSRQDGCQDDFVLWGLYLNFVRAAGDHANRSEHLWMRFSTALAKVFVFCGEQAGEPVYKLPRRYRYAFEKEVEARIAYLADVRDPRLLSLPAELSAMGIELTAHAFNFFIRACVRCGHLAEAYALAETKQWPLSGHTWAVLVQNVGSVDYKRYGKLGKTLHGIAQQDPPSDRADVGRQQ